MPTWNLKLGTWNLRPRRAFTLTELLVVISIIAIMAGLGLSAMAGATNMAREHRTGAEVEKIDQLIMERYEGYRTRAVPIRILPGTDPRTAARTRLTALRELMRLEMPDRISDLCNQFELADLGADNALNAINNVNNAASTPNLLTSMPALAKAYKRRAQRVMITTGLPWTTDHQGAECLYLILSTMRDGDKSALDYFDPTEVGDTDSDGFLEILDGWGTPIEFLRWPAGYAEQPGPDGAWGRQGVDDDGNGTVDDISEAGYPGSDDIVVKTMQTRNHVKAPDPFDPAKADPLWQPGTLSPFYPYAIFPLVYSAGINKSYDMNVGNVVYAATPRMPSDPYFRSTSTGLPDIGMVGDSDQDGNPLGWIDNITNHDTTTR